MNAHYTAAYRPMSGSSRRWRAVISIACGASTATASPSAAGARRGAPPVRRQACRPASSTIAGAAARTLIRASVPERVAMLLTGHKTRTIFDRDNIINEQELLDAGDQLVEYLAQHAQATQRGGRPHPARTAAPRTAHGAAPPPRPTHHRIRRASAPPGHRLAASDRGAAGSPDTARLGAADRALATHDGPARDRGTRGDGAGPTPPTGTCRQ